MCTRMNLHYLSFILLIPLWLIAQENIYLQKGMVAFSNGDYSSAQYQLKKAVETSSGPDKYDSYIYLGASYLMDGQKDRASEVLGQAIQLYPKLLPDNFAIPTEVVQFYHSIWKTYPVVKSISFSDFNPYKSKENTNTILPEILHSNYLAGIELQILKNNQPLITLTGLPEIQNWNGMVGDSPIQSGKYLLRFVLQTNRDERYSQDFPVEISASSPYGSRLQKKEQVKGLKDNSSSAMGLIWLGSMAFVAGSSMSAGTSAAQALAQGLLLGSVVGLPIMYVVGAAVGTSDDIHNEDIIKKVNERNKKIEENNRKIKETFKIRIKLRK